MIDQYALGQFINNVFMPWVPTIGGAVIGVTLVLLIYITFRDRFLDLRREENAK